MVNSLFCLRLHTAGVVVGWVGAAFSMLNVIIYAIFLARLDEIIQQIISDRNTAITPDSAKTAALIIFSVYLLINVINLLASILLIAGTIKERHLMLVPWLINAGISLVFSALNFIVGLVYMFVKGVDVGAAIVVIIIVSVVLGIQYMIWAAIYSLFKLIRTNTEQQRLLLPHKAGVAYPSYTRI